MTKLQDKTKENTQTNSNNSGVTINKSLIVSDIRALEKQSGKKLPEDFIEFLVNGNQDALMGKAFYSQYLGSNEAKAKIISSMIPLFKEGQTNSKEEKYTKYPVINYFGDKALITEEGACTILAQTSVDVCESFCLETLMKERIADFLPIIIANGTAVLICINEELEWYGKIFISEYNPEVIDELSFLFPRDQEKEGSKIPTAIRFYSLFTQIANSFSEFIDSLLDIKVAEVVQDTYLPYVLLDEHAWDGVLEAADLSDLAVNIKELHSQIMEIYWKRLSIHYQALELDKYEEGQRELKAREIENYIIRIEELNQENYELTKHNNIQRETISDQQARITKLIEINKEFVGHLEATESKTKGWEETIESAKRSTWELEFEKMKSKHFKFHALFSPTFHVCFCIALLGDIICLPFRLINRLRNPIVDTQD